MKFWIGFIFLVGSHVCDGQVELYDKSMQVLRKGDSNGAIQLLDELLKKYPDYVNGYFQRSLLLINRRDFFLAIKDYDQILRIEPSNQDILKQRATLKMNIADVDGALSDLSDRIRLNPSNAMHYFDRAHARGSVETADLAACVKDYDRAIQLKPDLREAYALRGYAKIYILTRTRKSNTIPANLVADPCSDLRKAKSMGDNSVDNMMRAYCN
ncbi:hypothetical protein BH09BAC3_BH09BAC3_18170 [soil metagenome]